MRRLLPLAAALAFAGGVPAHAQQPPMLATTQPVAPETVTLQVSPERSTTLTVWPTPHARGVVLFSTGHGSWPERYDRLVQAITQEGFAVLAPLHVDSMRYPERDRFTQMQSLPERFADMRATVAYAGERYPGLPLVAAGHSYGSLIALAQGGALANIMPARNSDVRAVLAFSTPGKIPGLVTDATYGSVDAPLLEITGTADTIPAQMGYASAPADHLLPVETAAGPAYGLVIADGGHGLVDDLVRLERALPAVRMFLKGYGLGDATYRQLLQRWTPAEGDRLIVHEGAE